MIGGETIKSYEKEILEAQLGRENEVLKELQREYEAALKQINEKIMILQADPLTQSRIYQLQYQHALKAQVEAILEKLHADEYSTIQQYLSDSYSDGFISTMYCFHKQDVPLILPIDKKAAVRAVLTDSKIKGSLYAALGINVKAMKKSISQEITRGIASGASYSDIIRNLRNATKAPYANAKTIVRTEGHRIQQASAEDARQLAKEKGADVVKQWDATMDSSTRPTHQRLDGQIKETHEPFTHGTKEAMYPGDFGDPAEDCNCRCVALTRARWALDEDELEELKARAEYFGLDKSDSFEDFKEKYLKVTDDWASADASAKERLGVDAMVELDKIVERGTTKIKQGFSAFSKDDILYERIKLVEPDGNKFDVAMHGTPSAVAFGGTEANMSPRLLASIIRHSPGYHGQEIRLLSCSTGRIVDDEYCFAEELANALGVTVYAPNDLLFILKSGKMYVGRKAQGAFVAYKPNERKRFK